MRTFALVLSFLAGPVLAGQFEDMTTQGHDFAASQKGYLDGLATGTDARAAQYGGASTITPALHPCNQPNAQGQTTCGGQVVDPAQNPQQFYGMSPVQLQDQARLQATTDETAKYVFDAHADRPEFEVRRDDPLFQFQSSNQTAMVGLSQSYAGCAEIQYGGNGDSTQTATCTKTGTATYRDTICQRTLAVTCSNADANQLWPFTASDFTVTGAYLPVSFSGNDIVLGGNGRGSNCAGWDSYVSFDVVDPADFDEFKLTSVAWDDSFLVTLNGSTVQMAYGGRVGTNPVGQRGCEFGTVYSNGTVKDMKPFLKQGRNTLRIWNKVGGTGFVTVRLRAIRYKHCYTQDSYSTSCPESFDRSKATVAASTCSAGAKTIYLGRTAVTRSCWEWQDTYRWESLPAYQEDAQCQALRSAGCYPTGKTTCNASAPGGWCSNVTLEFACGTGAPPQTMQVCGDTLVCQGGGCYDQYKESPDATQDFLRSASYLAAMEDMKKYFDPNNITVFKGEFADCSLDRTLIGTNQCCTGGTGFLNTLGATCSATEQKIIQAKQDQRVTQVRTYERCGADVAGVCVKWVTYYDYCLWPSKLARIIQDQGRALMGQTIDNPCPGFRLQNPNEFELIDWSRIDLSDYYSDVTAKYNATAKPDPAATINQVQQSNTALQTEYTERMQQYYGK